MSKCMLAVFSPTGGTEKTALAVAEGFGGLERTVDLSKVPEEQTIPAEEILIAAMPVFGGRVPAVARERLLRLHGQGGAAIAVVVYGNRAYDDALLELCDSLREGGFTVVSAGAFIAEHSMVRAIAAGRPDEKDLLKAKELGRGTAEKMESVNKTSVTVPGNPAYREKKPGGVMAPRAGGACVGCGACAAVCPVGAIPRDKPSQTGKNCIGCERCVFVCPHGARSLPPVQKAAASAMMHIAGRKRREPEIFL